MYCPQCSQAQVGEEMRFCSRCGFPLTIVAQLVANDGALAGFDPEAKGQLSPRQKGIRWGAILMISSVVLFPLAALMTAIEEDFIIFFFPVFFVFVFGLAQLLHAYLLAQSTPPARKSSSDEKTKRVQDAHRAVLPSSQNIPIPNWRQPVNTSEMVQPASVTDNTTRLLNDEVEQK